MKRHCQRDRRSGFTLIEMVCVLATMSLLMLFGTSLIVTVIKTGGVGDKTSDRVHQRSELAKQFRGDVAGAKIAPVKADGLEAGPALLLLSMPNGSTVIYRWNEDGLMRIERNKDKETTHRIPFDTRNTQLEFTRPTAGSRLISLRITQTPSKGQVNITDLSATIGGDSR
jgi:prepilin-type N-terminal cleavage/methylation domain-containing protein